MRLLRRRRRPAGRHALGEAVTGIPAAPRSHPAPALPEQPAPLTPRVELGFRDGTSAQLDPTSPHARALGELATRLSERCT